MKIDRGRERERGREGDGRERESRGRGGEEWGDRGGGDRDEGLQSESKIWISPVL